MRAVFLPIHPSYHTMISLSELGLPQYLFLAVALYLSWAILRPILVKSSLENLPGPSSVSFVSGESCKTVATSRRLASGRLRSPPVWILTQPLCSVR